MVTIRQTADTSNFGNILDRMPRDRTVCGLRNTNVRGQLLAKLLLTGTEAEEFVVAAEMTGKKAKEMQGAMAEEEACIP